MFALALLCISALLFVCCADEGIPDDSALRSLLTLYIASEALLNDDSGSSRSGINGRIRNSSSQTNTYYLWASSETTCPTNGSGALLNLGTTAPGTILPSSGYNDWVYTPFRLSSSSDANCSTTIGSSSTTDVCYNFDHTINTGVSNFAGDLAF